MKNKSRFWRQTKWYKATCPEGHQMLEEFMPESVRECKRIGTDMEMRCSVCAQYYLVDTSRITEHE